MLKNTEKIPESLGCDVIRHKGESTDVGAMKNILLKYYQPVNGML